MPSVCVVATLLGEKSRNHAPVKSGNARRAMFGTVFAVSLFSCYSNTVAQRNKDGIKIIVLHNFQEEANGYCEQRSLSWEQQLHFN
jgi:purine nucleoside permease